MEPVTVVSDAGVTRAAAEQWHLLWRVKKWLWEWQTKRDCTLSRRQLSVKSLMIRRCRTFATGRYMRLVRAAYSSSLIARTIE